MRILKTLIIIFCFSGLIISCGDEPKDTGSDSKANPITDTSIAVPKATEPASTTTQIPVDTLSDKTEEVAEKMSKEEMDKIALAAAEAQEREAKEEKEKIKAEKASEERRKKRRAKRHAERKRKAAEKEKREKEERESIKNEITENKVIEQEITEQQEIEITTSVPVPSSGKPIISFNKMVHNYGRISQGEKVKYDFVFTNTGNSELVISNVEVSCGCTHPSFPFIPIEPGAKDFITVLFDSKGRLGRQKPMITVTTNADPPTYKIYLEGTVDSEDIKEEKKENEEEQKEGN